MANRYWVGDGGTWNSSSSSHWSTSSGGTGGASVPTTEDDVFFDANSFTTGSQTVTFGLQARCKDLTFTGVTNSPTFAGSFAQVSGNVVGDSGAVFSTGFLQILPGINASTGAANGNSTSTTITSNGMSFGGITFGGGSGQTCTITLSDNLVATINDVNTIYLQGDATLNLNGFNLTTTTFGMQNNTVLNMGSGTMTVKSASSSNQTIISLAGTSPTINPGTSTLVIDLASFTGTTATISASSKSWTFYNVEVKGNSASKTVSFSTANLTMNNFTVTQPPVSIKVPSSRTYSFNTLTMNGSVGNLITLLSSTAGSRIKFSANTASVSYVDVIDNEASGYGAPFDNTVGGVDSGNNINWIFSGTVDPFIPQCSIF